MKEIKKGEIIIYKSSKGPEIQVKLEHDSVWLDAHLIAKLFNVNRPAIVKHINNVYKVGELSEKSTCSILEQVAADGRIRKMNLYNLDMIISVGYRVNSKQATQFRIWATKILKEHITKGYTINRKQVAKNYDAFMKAVTDVQTLLPEHVALDPKTILELIKEFSSTWVSLDAYDKETLKPIGVTKKDIQLTGEELTSAIGNLRNELMRRGEASDLFAQERARGNVEGIVGNVMQSFGGKPLYRSIEEKAAHLLYFMVKNHPFSDGNKRSGAFAFLWFLRKTKLKTMRNINPSALTAITLLIAESNPKKKDLMTGLVVKMLK